VVGKRAVASFLLFVFLWCGAMDQSSESAPCTIRRDSASHTARCVVTSSDFPHTFKEYPCSEEHRADLNNGLELFCRCCCCLPCIIHGLSRDEEVSCYGQPALPSQEPECCGCNRLDCLLWRLVCCCPCMAVVRACKDKDDG